VKHSAAWQVTDPAELLECLGAPGRDARPLPEIAVIVAHPDDETVGAGSRLPRLRDARFVYVTDGAPREPDGALACGSAAGAGRARTRYRELEAALALAGIRADHIRRIDCADQEASLHLAELSREIAGMLRDLRPTAVVTHPYEGGHPDHDATAFAVHAACRLLERQDIRPPHLLEMTSYHLRGETLVASEFLPHPGCPVTTAVLTGEERDLKRRLISCYATQRDTLCHFPVELERFRPAPRYDFTLPPHEGVLCYECFPWGTTGKRFRELAREALGSLGRDEPA
jgi:N-acetylglucosamine malate deacetylase 2